MHCSVGDEEVKGERRKPQVVMVENLWKDSHGNVVSVGGGVSCWKGACGSLLMSHMYHLVILFPVSIVPVTSIHSVAGWLLVLSP